MPSNAKYKYHKLRRQGIRVSWLPSLQGYCEGCQRDLQVGDQVYAFRHGAYVHTGLDCIQQLDKYLLTKLASFGYLPPTTKGNGNATWRSIVSKMDRL
jgi:hypothetical protein